MDSTTEKYPVCRERNTTAAFRWFYEPASVLAYLKARPATATLAAVQSMLARTWDRGMRM